MRSIASPSPCAMESFLLVCHTEHREILIRWMKDGCYLYAKASGRKQNQIIRDHENIIDGAGGGQTVHVAFHAAQSASGLGRGICGRGK